MSFVLKKIIKDQLELVLKSIKESEYVQTAPSYKNQIIYNFELGRAFGENILATDILNLNRYNLSEYLPKNDSEEYWQFEFETVHDSMILVDIFRSVKDGISYWSMKIGQILRGDKNQLPTLVAELNDVGGYEKFINTVNKNYSSAIDPSKY
jgi:hypothetical protein